MSTAIDKTIPLSPVLDGVEHVLVPIEQARGMPNAAYTDQLMFEFERDHVLGKTWAGIGHSSELPNAGYVKPLDFMGLSLALVRNRNGDIKVFHNVCSHRGMPLVSEETEISGLIRCAYHSWGYDLDGNLKGTPHIGGVGVHQVENFHCADNGLKEVRSAEWMGVIFVNLSADAESFERFIAPLIERWEEFTGVGGFEQLRVSDTSSHLSFEVASNWKLPVENYCEAYHLPWVHPALNSYSPLDKHDNLIVNDYMSGQGSRSYTLAQTAGTSLPQFHDWPENRLAEAEYISLYPNVLLGVQADHAFSLVLQPLAADRTQEKLELTFVGDSSVTEEYQACREAVLESWRVVFAEDIFAVEGMQKGRRSPAFIGGVFSPVMDTASHHFHQWVAGKYAAQQ